MDDLTRKRFEHRLREKLSAGHISENLVAAGLFLVAYELLRAEVIDKTRAFFLAGGDQSGLKISPRYATDVVALDKNRFRASCLWLARRGALSPEDVEVAWAIREQRHAVAHELSRYVVDPDASIDLTLFSQANRLMTALGRFWGRMVVETDERFDGQTVQDEEIESGPMILMNHILSVVRRHDT